MNKDFKNCRKGKLKIFIICFRSRKIRELSKCYLRIIFWNKKQLMAKMKSKKVLKKESGVASFIDVGK